LSVALGIAVYSVMIFATRAISKKTLLEIIIFVYKGKKIIKTIIRFISPDKASTG